MGNVAKYLEEYVNDLEGIENKLSTGNGYVSVNTVTSLLTQTKRFNSRFKFSNIKLFEIKYLFNKEQEAAIKAQMGQEAIKAQKTKQYNEKLAKINMIQEAGFWGQIKGGVATWAVTRGAFTEGVLHIGEMIIDTAATVGSWQDRVEDKGIAWLARSFGNDELSEKILFDRKLQDEDMSKFIGENWTKKR